MTARDVKMLVGRHWKIKKKKICLDCPAIINGIGNRQRCIPCSDKHFDEVTRKKYHRKK